MARNRDSVGGPGPGGDKLPPCATAGDDRVGPESPPWVQPSTSGSGAGYLAARDDELRRRCPTLHDFLTLTGWSGKQRKSGSLSLFCEDGKWKSCVNDRDGGFYAFLSADSFWGLLDALEHGLKSGSLEWRSSSRKK